MSGDSHVGKSHQLRMFMSTKEIMEGGWTRRGIGVYPKLVGTVPRGTAQDEGFRDKLLPVDYHEFPDPNTPQYFEDGTHGQKSPKGRAVWNAERRHAEQEDKKREPDAFDAAVAEHGDVTKVAGAMREQGMEDWLIEERVLKELSIRSRALVALNKAYIEGVTWDDIERTGDPDTLRHIVSQREDEDR